MPMLADLAADACFIGAAAGCLYSLGAAFLVHRFRVETEPPQHPAAAVSIFKPLHGSEPELERRLAAFCKQSYAGQVQVIFGCIDANDSAIPAVKRLKEMHPDADIELVAGGPLTGGNRKISNLINMTGAARHDVFVVSDSDIEVGAFYLEQVVPALDRRGVGAATCLYYGIASGNKAPANLSALAINAHFLPQVLVAIRFGLGQPCFGATIALRREMLDKIGSFRSFANSLADDYAIGNAVRAAGCKVSIPSFLVGHLCAERTFGEFFVRQLRAARTIKSIKPAGFAGAVIANPFPLALIAVLAGASGLLAVASILCRIVLCKAVERKFRLPCQKSWLLPATDLALFAVFLLSFFGSGVAWRGLHYRVLPDGTLAQIDKDRPD